MNTLTQTTNSRKSPFREVMGSRNFRLLWIGEGVSVLGDHFYMIALPWLVLQLTGDSLVMGTVLALAAIPRALLMLVGGALTDRFSPRSLMLASNAARFILVSILTGLVFAGRVELWMLYALAVFFGIADAFFYPAQSSMAPQLVKKEYLQVANSLIHLESIRSGLNFVWNDIPLRAFFFVVAAVTFFFNGPLNIGIPLLSDTRFPEGAVAYGTILSAWGAGSLVGMALAGMLPRPHPKRLGKVLLSLVSAMGIGLAFLGLSTSMILAAVTGLVLGAVNGYINVFFTTWVQSRAPKAFIGRLMSLLMFSSTGLFPVSMALSGAASRVDVTLLLIVSGGIVALLGILMTLNPTVRAMEPAPQAGD